MEKFEYVKRWANTHTLKKESSRHITTPMHCNKYISRYIIEFKHHHNTIITKEDQVGHSHSNVMLYATKCYGLGRVLKFYESISGKKRIDDWYVANLPAYRNIREANLLKLAYSSKKSVLIRNGKSWFGKVTRG